MFLKEKQNISKTDNCLSLDLFVISNVAGATYAQTYAQAGSPNYSEQPCYGTAELEAGFLPDPHSVAAVSGGNTNVRDCSNVTPTCVGNVMSNPDYSIYLSGNSSGIRFLFW